MEEARVARREEVGRPGKMAESQIEKVSTRNPMIRNVVSQGRVRYDNRPREYINTPGRERTFAPTRDQQYFPTPVYPKAVHEINEKEQIPLSRSLSEILETAHRVPRFYVPGNVNKIRGTPWNLVCRYHNQYEHSTNRCRNLRLLVDKLIREGRLKEFVKGENNNNQKGGEVREGAGGARHNPIIPPVGEPKQKIYMITGGENTNISNRTRLIEIRQATRREDEVMQVGKGKMEEISFG